jgi:lysine 2,3-aminomutase
MQQELRPRGRKAMLVHGGLPEVIPPYLKELIQITGGESGPIGRQFIANIALEALHADSEEKDPLNEDEHEVAPGLIYKYRAKEVDGHLYSGRALFTITYTCSAYCRFCTRGREVGIPEGYQTSEEGPVHSQHLSRTQIDQSLAFIEAEPGLNEVILSGGDPLTVKPEVLTYVLSKLGELQKSDKLSVVRIGSRLPIHNPRAFKPEHYHAIEQLENPRLMIHINHPDELTDEAIQVLKKLRSAGAILHSQTVLLKGVNDNVQTLYELFSKCVKNGISPYYVFQNDPVYWARHFTVPMDEAIQIWQALRPKLSGIAATARFVIDVPHGYGKVPVPEGGAWNVDYDSGYIDFEGGHFVVEGHRNRD